MLGSSYRRPDSVKFNFCYWAVFKWFHKFLNMPSVATHLSFIEHICGFSSVSTNNFGLILLKNLQCCLSRPLDDLNCQLYFALAVCIFVLSLFTFFAIHVQDKYFSLFDLILKSLVWIINKYNIVRNLSRRIHGRFVKQESHFGHGVSCDSGEELTSSNCLRYYKCHFLSRLTYRWSLF